MVSLKLTTLALAALHTLSAVAQIPEGLEVLRHKHRAIGKQHELMRSLG